MSDPAYHKILVTGASGFVGSYVVRDLVQKGYDVTAVRRRKTLPAYIDAGILNRARWIEGDILDTGFLAEALAGHDAVVHAAAAVSFSDGDPAAMFSTNIDGTANVVNAAIECGIARLVYVSSVAALGRNKNIVVTEKQTWEPNRQNTRYAISKHQGEIEVWRGMAEGLSAVIVNPSTILGYGDWNESSSALFRTASKGFPWYTNGITGFVDVQDVSRAIIDLMNSGISGERFIVNSENWSFRQLLSALAEGFHQKRPSMHATPFMAAIAWRLARLRAAFTGRDPMLTKQSVKVARTHTEYDHSKILNALPGFRFRPVAEIIREACDRYRLQKPV